MPRGILLHSVTKPSWWWGPDEEYTFLNGTYTWWDLITGVWGTWSLGNDWIAPASNSTRCILRRAAPSWNFRLQHREGYYSDAWWGASSMGVCNTWPSSSIVQSTNNAFQYWSTITGGYNQWSWIYINGAKKLTTSQLTSWNIYIDEIIYENGVYTVSLYEDVNGEPGTKLYTATATANAAPVYLWLYHEWGTGTKAQTNRIKVRHL